MVIWSYVIPVLLVLVIYVLKFVNLKTNKSKLPLGGRGWPIVGDSLRWYNAVASSNPTTFVQQQVLRYGKIFSCNIFGRMAVVSVDPAFNRFVMHNEGKLFKSSYPKSFRDLVGTNGVITAQGDQHRKLHTIASNMMRSDALKTRFLMDIQQVLNQTFADLHHNQTILLQDVCRKLAINLMVNQLLGVSSDNEVGEMAQLFSDFVDGCLSVPINLPGFAYHTAMNEEHQHIRKKRLDISGEVDMLTWEDYKSMSFTQHVIDETLRLGGIAIWLMREAKEDVEYQDYIIPKGSFVVPFLSAVHQDENFYDGATTFNPCRWMDPNNQDKRNWRNSPYYSPFGGGPRLCPGAELARLQIALFLHYFIVSYRWSEVKEDRMSFFPSARLVNGFPIQLSKRA
ncbi:putative abieta-7,13-dien-18-ol hydroxylase [Helianthus annuus]|nr:putative abieta-7,13-dien-18-ol hydroxylase [Helianthus annuus]